MCVCVFVLHSHDVKCKLCCFFLSEVITTYIAHWHQTARRLGGHLCRVCDVCRRCLVNFSTRNPHNTITTRMSTHYIVVVNDMWNALIFGVCICVILKCVRRVWVFEWLERRNCIFAIETLRCENVDCFFLVSAISFVLTESYDVQVACAGGCVVAIDADCSLMQ